MNFFKGKTILVTGATGFIGTHLVSRLSLEQNVRLLLLSRKFVSESRECIISVTTPLDLLSSETWRAVGIDKIDVVFHLGAFTPKCAGDVDRVSEVFRDNLLGTRALLDSFSVPPERIIFASTLDVYAAKSMDCLLDEGSPLGPSGLYGASKLFCEQLVKSYAKTNGCGCAILRYGHIFGPGEEDYAKLIPKTIKGLLKGETPLLYGDGSAERDFLFVDDAVEATLRAASSDKQEIGPLNIVRGSSVSVRKVVETLITIIGFKEEITYLADKPCGPSFRFDSKNMRETLGEWGLVSVEEGLEREVRYFQSSCAA